jgi:predicted ATPase
VYYEGAQTAEIVISLDDNAFAFLYEDKDSNELRPLHNLFHRGHRLSVPDGWQYLNCERSGPRSSFPMSDAVVRGRRQLGVRGEYAAHFLSVFGEESVAKAVQHEAAASPSLRDQTDAWLREVSPGSNVRVYHHTEMDLVRLSVQFRDTRATSREYRPTNVGFGITYLLPVIVAGLAARSGSLLMVENPEAHLHPRGQGRMGQFLARVAAGGVQVLVETHSDHLLNGIRVSVHDGELPPEDVAIHYFERRVTDERFVHGVTSPGLDRDGRIDQWPDGFFDQWENALQKLLFPAG